MKNIKKILMTLGLCSSLIIGGVTTSFASDITTDTEKIQAYGGWSESEGYYNNILTRSASKPDKHTGKRMSTVDGGGNVLAQAYGETVWKGYRHYTTARMEKSNGTVLRTSGQQWDYNYTDAASGYIALGIVSNYEARTYWGR